MLICKKGVIEGDIFTSEQGEKYQILNLISPFPTKCYIQLENSKLEKWWKCTRKINIKD